jgi:hypothetical protein
MIALAASLLLAANVFGFDPAKVVEDGLPPRSDSNHCRVCYHYFGNAEVVRGMASHSDGEAAQHRAAIRANRLAWGLLLTNGLPRRVVEARRKIADEDATHELVVYCVGEAKRHMARRQAEIAAFLARAAAASTNATATATK